MRIQPQLLKPVQPQPSVEALRAEIKVAEMALGAGRTLKGNKKVDIFGPQSDTSGNPSRLLSARRFGKDTFSMPTQMPRVSPQPVVTHIGPGMFREVCPNGDIYTGPMQNGLRHGEGSLMRGGMNYEGNFVHGRQDGVFTVKAPDGREFNGAYANGILTTPLEALPNYVEAEQVVQAQSDPRTRFDSREISSVDSSPVSTPEQESIVVMLPTPSPVAEAAAQPWQFGNAAAARPVADKLEEFKKAVAQRNKMPAQKLLPTIPGTPAEAPTFAAKRKAQQRREATKLQNAMVSVQEVWSKI